MSPDLYLVLHIPKTAGSTLSANFRGNFSKGEWLPVFPAVSDHKTRTLRVAIDAEIKRHKTPRTRCAFGHWVYWGIHEKIRPQARPLYITFLRDPVERCISAHGYARTRPANGAFRAIVDNHWSLEHGQDMELFNGQVRHLLYDGSNDILLEADLTRDHLEAAKERLRESWFVGLTESFDFDSSYLYGKLNFWRFHVPRVVNATRDKPLATPQERQAPTRANELDAQLYAFARELRGEWLRDHANDIARKQRRARSMMRIFTVLRLGVQAGRKLTSSTAFNRAQA